MHVAPGPVFDRMPRLLASVLLGGLLAVLTTQQPPPRRFGGAYAELDQRRQLLVDDWVARLANVTGQTLPPREFYDEILSLSTKTTFDAVTHALMTTPLID